MIDNGFADYDKNWGKFIDENDVFSVLTNHFNPAPMSN